MGKHEEAILCEELALTVYKGLEGTERDRGSCYLYIGNALWAMGSYEEAIQRYEQPWPPTRPSTVRAGKGRLLPKYRRPPWTN